MKTDRDKKPEKPPLVRMVGENGIVVYPKMKPDGKGDWEMSDPKAIAEMLGTPPPSGN